jgi:serine protease Do
LPVDAIIRKSLSDKGLGRPRGVVDEKGMPIAGNCRTSLAASRPARNFQNIFVVRAKLNAVRCGLMVRARSCASLAKIASSQSWEIYTMRRRPDWTSAHPGRFFTRPWRWAAVALALLSGTHWWSSPSAIAVDADAAPAVIAPEAAPAAIESTVAVATMPTPAEIAREEAAKAAAKESLEKLFGGATPSNLSDLRTMQDHIRQLTDQLVKTTVGVTVGNAQGSGVIISKDGYVLTAAHVASRPNRDVVFLLSDGRKLKGKTLGLNRSLDSGLMKIDGVDDLPFAEMGKIDGMKLGQWCLATGHPGGYQEDRQAVLRLGRVQWISNDKTIVTDCTLVGGDSGGPLFDMYGRVIGINSRIASDIKANMHVPVSTFSETWDRLTKAEAWGHYPGETPYLGVKGAPEATNAELTEVKPGSPAEKGDLKVGDVVLKFGKKDISDFKSLIDAVQETQPKEKVKVTVQRGEETKELSVEIGQLD